jgi:predicted metal-dependent hydrolase
LRDGVDLFNRGDFFECHEALEAVWLETSGEDRVFLQGLIQIAVSFYHLRHGNLVGSARLLSAALEKLSTPSKCRHLINTADLVETLTPLLAAIQSGEASRDTPAPEIRLVSVD